MEAVAFMLFVTLHMPQGQDDIEGHKMESSIEDCLADASKFLHSDYRKHGAIGAAAECQEVDTGDPA